MGANGDADEAALARATDPAPAVVSAPPEVATATIPIILPVHQHVRVWMILSIVLGVLLIAAIAIGGYLWNVESKWEEQVADLTSTAYDLGDRIAENETQINQLQSTNELLTQQLATAKDRVLTLSSEKARWGDDAAYAQQQVALLEGQISQAATVANQLGRCVEGEQQLVTYLQAAPDTYTPEEIADFATSVNQLCATATQAHADLQKALTP